MTVATQPLFNGPQHFSAAPVKLSNFIKHIEGGPYNVHFGTVERKDGKGGHENVLVALYRRDGTEHAWEPPSLGFLAKVISQDPVTKRSCKDYRLPADETEMHEIFVSLSSPTVAG
jgi:hypothetical protein